MQCSCQVPKESYMAQPISDLRSTRQNAAACHSTRLWDCSVPSSGRDLGVRGHVRAFESGDMSPHSKASAASAAKPPRPGCVTRHNFMFFCLSCPLVRCSLPTRWIHNFCVGWRNCFRGREPTQKLPRQRTRGTISCACSERWSFRFCPCRDRSSVASCDLCHLASTLPRCCASPLVSSFPLLVPGKTSHPCPNR